jgi:hypothetical protein
VRGEDCGGIGEIGAISAISVIGVIGSGDGVGIFL